MKNYLVVAAPLLASIGSVLFAQTTEVQTSRDKVSSPGLAPPATVADEQAALPDSLLSVQEDATDEREGGDPSNADSADDGSDARTAENSAQSREKSVEEGGLLFLLCFGGGAANKSTVVQGYGSTDVNGYVGGNAVNLSGTSNTTVWGTRSQGFEDQVSLSLQGGEGRVRMPRTMLPPIHGGESGWFKLKKIKFKQDEITASVAVNVLNNPKLRIDRHTGAISISGKAGDFAGMCKRINPEEVERQF